MGIILVSGTLLHILSVKPEGTGCTYRNTMDFAAKPLQKARGTYCMHELRTVFPYGLNDRIGDEFKTANKC